MVSILPGIARHILLLNECYSLLTPNVEIMFQTKHILAYINIYLSHRSNLYTV